MKLKRGTRPAASSDSTGAKTRRGRRGTGDSDFYRATVFLPRPTREVLAQHGIKHGMSLQEIVENAMAEWLERNGYPAFYPDGWTRQGKTEKDEDE